MSNDPHSVEGQTDNSLSLCILIEHAICKVQLTPSHANVGVAKVRKFWVRNLSLGTPLINHFLQGLDVGHLLQTNLPR